MANEDRLKLFKAINKAGYDIGSYDDFDKRMNNADDRQKFYTAVNEAGYDIGSQEDFERRISPSKYKIKVGDRDIPVSEREYKDFLKRHPGGSSSPAPKPQQTPAGGAAFGLPEGMAYSDEVERRHDSPSNMAGSYKDRAQIASEVQSVGLPAYGQGSKRPVQRDASSYGIPYRPDTELTAAQRDEIAQQNGYAAKQVKQMRQQRKKERRRRNQPVVDTGNENVNRHVIKTQGQWEDEVAQGASRISHAVVAPAVKKAIEDFDKKAHEVFEGTREGANNGGLPTGSASGATIFGSIKESNKANDPEKVLDYLKGQMEALYKDQSFIDEVGEEADKMGIDRNEYLEKVVKPQIEADLGMQFDNAMIDKYLPKSGKEYVVSGLSNSIIGMLADAFLETKGQRAYKNEAAAMTEEGLNPHYTPGTGAKLAQMGVSFAADAPFFGFYGKVGGNMAKRLAETQIRKLTAKGLSEGAARSIVGTALENSVGQRMKNYIMQHVVSSSITMGGYNATSETARQVRDREFKPGQIIGSTAEGLATGAAFGLTGGAVQALSQPLSGIARIGSKVGGYLVEGETMYTTEELAKMVHGEEGFTNPFEGSAEAMMKLGVMKVSSPGGLSKAAGELFHPIKSNRRQQTGIRFTPDEEAYVRDSAEGKSLLDALSRMHPEVATTEVKGKRQLTAEGEQLRQELAERYSAFMGNTEIPYAVKAKVAGALGGLMPDAAHTPLETGADIIHNADGSVILKTRDKDGNCMQELKFDSFSEADNWREEHEGDFRLNDAVNMWNSASPEARANTIRQLMEEYGIGAEEAATMVKSVLGGSMGTDFSNDQFLYIYDAVRNNAFPADEPNTRRNYWEGQKLTERERHQAMVDAQQAEDRLAEMDQAFAEEVIGAADYPDEKIAELAGRDEITGEQLQAAIDYYNKAARFNGMMEKAAQSIDDQVEAANAFVRRNTHKESGSVVEVESDGRGYYLTAGKIELNPDGTLNMQGSGDVMIMRDKETGEIQVTNPHQIKVTALNDPQRMIAENESMDGLRGQLMQEANNSITLAEGTPEAPQNGDYFTGADGIRYMAIGVPDEQGNVVWSKIAVDEKGEPAGEPTDLDIDEYRKAKSDEIDRESQIIPEEEIVSDVPETVNHEGEIIPVEAAEQPLPQQEEKTPVVEEANIPNTEKARSSSQSAFPRIPVVNGKTDWESASAEDSRAALTGRYGEEKAREMVSRMITNLQQSYDELLKKDVSKMTDMDEIASYEDELADIKRKMDYWRKVFEEKPAEEVRPEEQPKVEPPVSEEPESVPAEPPAVMPQEPAPAAPEKHTEPQPAVQPPVQLQPQQPTAEQKIAEGSVKANLGKTFEVRHSDGRRTEMKLESISPGGRAVVTQTDYDAQGSRIGEPQRKVYNVTDIGGGIIKGIMKPVLTTDEKLRKQFKFDRFKQGDVPIIDVLTDVEKQQILDAFERGDKETVGNLTGEFMNAHQEDIILKGRDIRNEKAASILNGNAGVEEKLRKLRRLYDLDIVDGYLSNDALYPSSAEDWVSALHSRVPKSGEGRLAYFSYDRDGSTVVGMQDETGFGAKTGGDTKGFAPWLAPKGKGMSLQKYAEMLHGQLPESVQEQYSDQDMRNAVLEVFGSVERPGDIPTMILRRSAAQAEQALRNMEDRWIEDGPSYQKVTAGNAFASRLERAMEAVNTEPTEAQKQAGNYKKGHIRVHGLDISIENPKGSVRRGTDADGKEWETTMQETYGYIRGTVGADGDQIDVFLSDDPTLSDKVFIVQQRKKVDGAWKFDELKVLLGFDDASQASNAYLSNYEEGWDGMQAIIETDIDSFKEWLKNGNQKGTYKEDGAWAKVYPGVSDMVADEGEMPEPEQQEVEVLRGKGDNRMPGMGGELSEVFGGRGQTAISQSDAGQNRREQGLLQGELQVDGLDNTIPEPKDGPLPDLQGQNDVNATVGSGNGTSAGENKIQNTDVPLERGENAGNSGRDQGQLQNDNLSGQNDENGRLGEGTQPELQNAEEQGETGLDNGKDSRDASEHKADGNVKATGRRESVLMGAVVDKMREAGIDVSTDWEEGQRVLDEYNGSQELKPMGSTTLNRMTDVATELSGIEMTDQQSVIASVFSGEKDNQIVTLDREDGSTVKMKFLQGKDTSAGTKHSLFAHYGTTKGIISANDILRIPDIISKGERKQKGKNVEYTLKDGKTTFTVYAKVKGGMEVFQDFYSSWKVKNKRESASKPSITQDGENTQSAQSDDANALSGAKVQQNTETGKESGENLKQFKTPDGHAYGFTYKGKIYIDPRIATSETPIHEYGHLWAEMKRQTAPEEWDAIKDVLLNDKLVKPIIDRVKKDYPELAKEGREDDFIEEILTQFSGKRGAERLREIAQEIAAERGGVFGKAEAVTAMQRLKGILARFWEGVAKMMGWKYRNANEIADKIMSDMLEGVNPREKTNEASHKQRQLDIVTRENPMHDDYHTGIRKLEDIKTFEEAYDEGKKASEEGGFDEYASYPDITNELIEDARKSGKITIYSSYPIKDGVFVTPSMMQAKDYAGEGRVYSKRVPLEDVAWINLDEGQYAKVSEAKHQKENAAARDKEYADAVAAGDTEKVDAMLREEAARKGYSEDSSYQGSIAFNGAAPSKNSYFETREERKEAMENGTFEDTFSLGDYAEAGIDANDLEWQLANPIPASAGDKATLESIRNLNAAIKGKTGKVKMYRAVDAAVKEDSFRNGDWVTPSRKYAEQHIGLQDWKKGRIIEEEVPIDDIWWNGDDINEWGYDDGKGYAYKNAKNNRKLMEPTYDDDGNLIPLSKRFNDRKADIRFQKKPHEPKYQLESYPEPELTPEERQYWKKYEAAMKKWKERNALPAEAYGPGEQPTYSQGESVLDYAKRVAAYNRAKALWQTAPKLEDYRQARDDKMISDDAHEAELYYGDFFRNDGKHRRIAADLARIRHAMSRQKAYDKATVKAVTDFAQDFMRMGFGDNLSRGEMERLLSSVKNATGAKDIRNQVDNIMNILIDNQLRNLDQQVVKLSSVKELSKTAQGVEKQGRLELKGQRMIQAFRQAREGRMDAEKIRERLGEVAEKMSRNDEEAPMWEQEYEGLSIALQYQENIEGSRDEWADLDREYKDAMKGYKQSGRSYKAQQELLESLEQAMMENKIERIGMFGDIIGRLQGNISESMQGAREFVEREKNRVKHIQQIANFDLAGKDMGAMREKVKGKPANFFFQPLATFEQMLRQFGSRNANGEGYLFNHFMRSWMDSTDKAYVNEQKAKEELDAKAREVFGDKVKRWSDLYEIARSLPTLEVEVLDGEEPKTFTLNQGNLLYIYMADKMTDGRMKLRKMGIDEETVEKVKDFLDPRLVQLGDWLQDDYLVQKRIEYNKVHERMFGAPMAAIDHYFPLKILGDARYQEQDVSNMADQDAVLPSTITGNIIKRRKNALPLDILHTDALSLAIEHVEDMERWAATAEWNKDINTLLSYTTFRNKVKNMKTIYGSGDALWNTFADTARMAAGTYRPKAKPGSVDAAISNIAKGVTAAKINFRVYTAFKQLLSAPAFLHDVNIGDFVKDSVNPYGSWKWAMENMPVFRKRWKSRQVGDTRLMDDPTDWKMWKTNLVQMATRMGMSPNALVDGVTCAVGARAIYQSRYKKYKGIGASDEVAHKRALQDAEIGYNLTQQSSEGAFVSAIQKDRTVAANMLSVFRNSSMAYTRQWVDAARNLKHRTQKGYKEDAIGFMTRQLQEQFDIDEAQAKKAAEAEYARAGRHDVARLLNMMFGVTVAWNLGASLPYLLIGDDDETKKEMMTDALLKGLLAGPTEGLAAGNIISDMVALGTNESVRKAFGNSLGEGWQQARKNIGDYEINPLPLFADLDKLIGKTGRDGYDAAQDVFNICVQSAVGVNPQTFTDMWNACMDYGAPGWDGTKYSADADNLARPKEIALFIMRLMNAPTSSWRNKYIDELGMNAEDAKKLSYEEMASRYAHYKHWKDAPIMGWLRGEEGREEKIGKIRKQFDKSVQERIDRLDDEELRYNLLRSKSLEERRLLAKAVASRFGLAAGEDAKNAKEQWQQNYQQLMEYEDIREDALLSAKKKEANARGDHKTVKAINDLQSRIREKGKKKLGGDDDAELMQKIRQWRREALEKAIQAESR